MESGNFESDAEWIDVAEEFPELKPRATTRPTTNWITTPGYTTPRYKEDAPERLPPSAETNSDVNIIVAGVVGGILGVVLILLTFYLLFLKKKLMKVKGEKKTLFSHSIKPRDEDYRIRIEDIAHLDHIEESGPLYVNTTDIQRLVSTVKEKKKKTPPPSSDVVFVNSPATLKPGAITINSTNVDGPAYSNQTVDTRSEVSQVVRPAPPPPVKISNENVIRTLEKDNRSTLKARTQVIPPKVPPPSPPESSKPIPQVSLESISDKFSKSKSKAKCPPSLPVLPKPTKPIQGKPDLDFNSKPIVPNTVKPSLPSNPKPNLPPTKPEPPKTSKPKPLALQPPHLILTQPDSLKSNKIPPEVLPKPRKGPKSPLLPPLRVDLKLPSRSLDSACITPETALTDIETPDPSSAGVSVSARKALLEGKLAVPSSRNKR